MADVRCNRRQLPRLNSGGCWRSQQRCTDWSAMERTRHYQRIRSQWIL